MGYRSEVGVVVKPLRVSMFDMLSEFADDDLDSFAVMFDLEESAFLNDVAVTASMLRLHLPFVKWSVPENWPVSSVYGYAEVGGWIAFVNWCTHQSYDESSVLASDGAYAAIGEEFDDLVSEHWGENSYDLLNVQREMYLADIE